METIYQAVLDGDIVGCPVAVQAALDEGAPAGQILKEGLIAPMGEVGADAYAADASGAVRRAKELMGIV